MLKQALEILNPRPGQNFIDCTLGGGGYAQEIAKKIAPGGKVLAIDLDEMAVDNFKKLKLSNVILAHDNFKNLKEIVKKNFPEETQFDGIVFDLGLSTAQLDDGDRGFSFLSPNSPLRMNFGKSIRQNAEEIINHWRVEDIASILRRYGEERFAYKIARAIGRRRETNKIKTAGQLVRIILETIPKKFQAKKIHPATKTFQALRIAVNEELDSLAKVLPPAAGLLKAGGKLAVISYHSLEDRIVKQYFKSQSIDCLCPPEFPICRCDHRAKLKILTRKILAPAGEEVLNNPRARSAKLRVAEKI